MKKLTTTKLVLLLLSSIFVLLVGLVLLIVFWPPPPLVVSKETTYLTEPLDEEGFVDYVAALEAKYFVDLPPEENAARAYVLALGPDEYLDEHARGEVFEQLALTEADAAPPYLEYVEDFGARHPELVVATKKAQGIKLKKVEPEKGEEDAEADATDEQPEEEDASIEEDEFESGGFAPIIFSGGPAVSIPPSVDEEPDIYDLCQHWDAIAMSRPWKAEQLPLLAGWLEEQQPALDHLRAGSKYERCFFPIPRNGSNDPFIAQTPLGNLSWYSSLSQVTWQLPEQAMLHVGNGREELAWSGTLVLFHLGRHLAAQPGPYSNNSGLSLYEAALKSTANVVHYGKFTSEQLAEIAAQFDRLPALEPQAEEYRGGERLALLDTLQALARGRISAEDLGIDLEQDGPRLPGIDWNVVMRMANERFDRLEQTADLPPGRRRRELAAGIETDINNGFFEEDNPGRWAKHLFSRKQRSESVAKAILADMLYGAANALEYEETMLVRHSLTRVAIALARHRAEHGEYPEQLADLVPTFLAEAPLDMPSGEPLIYRRTEQGFLLYGVGPNGQDNGGKNPQYHEMLNVSIFEDIVLQQPQPIAKPTWEVEVIDAKDAIEEETEEASKPVGAEAE